MKTEKRLTMALSVLVALMMLAVPLASSSNLFVDGGQTNSNGDAPTLGAAGDTLTINLNIPENSLDSISYEALKTNLKNTTDVVYSIDEDNGVIRAVCINDSKVTVESVLNAVKTVLGYTVEISKSTEAEVDNVDESPAGAATSRAAAYALEFSGDYKTIEGPISGQMTANAVWKLNNDYAEVTFNTSGLLNNTSMVKAYKIDAGMITVAFPEGLTTAANGYVVNLTAPKPEVSVAKTATEATNPNIKPVYTKVVKTANGTEIVEGAKLDAKGDLTLSVIYTFDNLNYGEISVNSPIFEDDITFYVAKTTGAVEVAATTYYMVFNALISTKYLNDVKDSTTPIAKGFNSLDTTSEFILPLTANSGSCEIYSWTNGSEDYALNSNSSIAVGSTLTLNAEFKTFPVTFMVKGQIQTVDVRYGDFSETSCPFDTTGMTVWVENSASYPIFSFDRSAEELQAELIRESGSLTLIALFSAYDDTKYVTFDAAGGYFGDKDDNISKIIVPVANGTTADKIPVPVNPSKDAADGISYLFAYWMKDNTEFEFKSTEEVDPNLSLSAKFVDYKFVINFFVDNNKYATIYCKGDVTYKSAGGIGLTEVTGVLYDGKTYASAESMQSLIKYIVPEKAGYDFVQWNDKDGNMMLTLGLDGNGDVEVKNVGFSKISANTDLYAEFEAAEYVIIYSGNTAAATNNMIQVGTVGESLNFYSDSTFSNDGYKLKEWNTRPDGNGTSYALGSAFTLSGEDYAKLSKVATGPGTNIPDGITHGFTLYAIWEKVGTSDVPGDNTDGGNDSNTDTYLLAGILVVIIVLIVLLAFLLRKKN